MEMQPRRDMSLEQLLSVIVVGHVASEERFSNSTSSVTVVLNMHHDTASSHHTTSANLSKALVSSQSELEPIWLLEPGKGQYPTGSKMLKGDSEIFVISPLSSIVDEKYTAYFDFET